MKKLVCSVVVVSMLGIVAPYAFGVDTNQEKKTVVTDIKKKEINNEATKGINTDANTLTPDKIKYHNQVRDDAIKSVIIDQNKTNH